MRRAIWFLVVAVLNLALIVACGGGGDSPTPSATVRLSGTVGVGELPTNQAPPTNTSRRFASSPERQIVVLAVDAAGNSYATPTDKTGFFEFVPAVGLKRNTAYALVFIDMSTLSIVATLTSSSGEAGMLALRGDTELAEVVIDPRVQLSAVIGAVTIDGKVDNLEISSASTLDLDADGRISEAEILSTLVDTIQVGEIDTVTSVSAFTFLGLKNTWTIAVDLEDDAFDDSLCDWVDEDNPDLPAECGDDDELNDPEIEFLTDSGEFTVLATERARGPDGDLVDVAKLLEMTFLNRPYPDPDNANAGLVDTSLIWEVGYASGLQSDINDTATQFGSGPGTADEYWSPYSSVNELDVPPTSPYSQRMGLLGWSEYSYADTEQGILVNGAKVKDDDALGFSFNWGESSLPLNLPLNQEFEFTETETNEFIDPETGQVVIESESVTSLITIRLALNSDGSPALLQEAGTGGGFLPVFQIRFTDPADGESECSYIVARYGSEGDDADEDCDDMSDWRDAFVDIRFGRIDDSSSPVTIVDRTPAGIIANDSPGPVLPVDGSGQLSATTKQWLTYIFDNTSTLDYQYQPFGADGEDDFGQTSEFLAWVQWPSTGSPLAPVPAQTLLRMGQSPGIVSVNNVHYNSTDSGVQFYFDLRTTDTANPGEFSVLISPIEIDPVVGTSAATTSEMVINIAADLPALPPEDSSLWRHTWSSLEDPDATGGETYLTSELTLWVIMDADADLATTADRFEFPVDAYKVIGPEL